MIEASMPWQREHNCTILLPIRGGAATLLQAGPTAK